MRMSKCEFFCNPTYATKNPRRATKTNKYDLYLYGLVSYKSRYKINLDTFKASKKEKTFFNDIMHLRMQKNIKVMIVKESFKRFLN